MQERRRYVRIDLCIKVNYKLASQDRQVLKSSTKNISTGGMCFLAGDKFNMGTILDLTFRLPDKDKEKIDCKAKVIWQSKEGAGYLTGIEFIDLDLNKQTMIKTFVSRSISELTKYELP